MKMSKYNIYHEVGDKMLVYNSLSGKFGVIRKLDLELSHFECNIMLKNGFAVEDTCDERFLAEYQFFKTVYTPNLNLTILASENCNFRCAYCFDNFDGKNVDEGTIQNIILYIRKHIRQYTALNISWFGGEPLLAINEIERLSDNMISICQAASRPYFASITTNGYLLDLKIFRSLLKRKVYSFEITLDGFSDVHDRNRPHKDGRGSYQNILENLRSIRDNVKSRMFQIIIRINITKSLLGNLVEFAYFLKKEFGEDKRFIYRFSLAYDWGGERIQSIRGDLLDSITDVYKKLLINDINLSADAMISTLYTRMCPYAQDNTYTITSNGGIIICPQINENCLGRLEDGNMELNQYELAKWHSLDSQNIRTCKECGQYFLCRGKVCPANLKAIADNRLDIQKLDCKMRGEEVQIQLEYLYKVKEKLFIHL